MSAPQNGGLAASVNDRAAAAYSYAQRSIDRVAPPSSRQRAYDAASDYASRRPILFSLIATQAVLCSFFVLAFVAFALSTFALSLGAAVLFTVFWMGVAFAFITPAVVVASCIAGIVWAWAVVGFLVVRWVYYKTPLAGTGTSESVGTKIEGGKIGGG